MIAVIRNIVLAVAAAIGFFAIGAATILIGLLA